MPRLYEIARRIRMQLRGARVDRELEEEMQLHIHRRQEKLRAQGLSEQDARHGARRRFGSSLKLREESADIWKWGWLDDLGRDARHTVRQLGRSPGFAVSALLCLAIGIGATTAIYSVVDTILLQPLPFPESDRLVRIVERVGSPADMRGRSVAERGITYQEFLEWRTHATTLADASAVLPTRRTVRTSRGVARLWGVAVSGDAFALVGGRAMLGRTLGSADADNPGVIVLSFHAWQRHFNSDPTLIGTAIQPAANAPPGQNGAASLTVVGVMPAGFEFPTAQLTRAEGGGEDFLTPIPTARAPTSATVTMIARLAPGVSLAAAVDEANTMGAAIRPPAPTDAPTLTVPRFHVERLKDLILEGQQSALQALLGAVAIVLLIVCANVANLLLARGTARRREIAVRLAIGASRGRLVRQMMTESMVLALAGGAAGAAIGAAGITLVKGLATVDAPGIFRLTLGSTILPRAHEVGIDFKVLGIAFGLAVCTSVLFGAWPALRLSRTERVTRAGSHGMSAGIREAHTRAGLVIGQLALATTVLVAAGLLTHSFKNLSTVNNGYDSTRVVALNLLFPNQYSVRRKVDTIEALLTRFRSTPDVQAAGFSRHGLLINEGLSIGAFVPPGRTLEEFRDAGTLVRSVSGGYLTAMGVPVLAGREFQVGDAAMASPVLVLNRSAARRYFGSANPVGQVLDWHVGDGRAQMAVIGVVEDVRQESPLDDVDAEVFVEYRQLLPLIWKQSPLYQSEWALGVVSFAVRTAADPVIAMPAIREAVTAVDVNVAVDAIAPMSRLLGSSVARQRFYMVLVTAFAGVSGLLAAIGVYGVLAYSVAQRTQEFGIRITLGAPRAQLLGLVLGRGLMLTTIGIALGLVGAAGMTRALQGMLFGVTPLDTETFLVVSLMFAFVTTCASYAPARRAMNVDPVVALRSE